MADPAETGPEITVPINIPASFSTVNVTEPSFTNAKDALTVVTVAVNVTVS